jgi:hypothetical protein
MTIFAYFTDDQIKLFLPDVKRISSLKISCHDVLLYSEEIQQIIYIKESDRKQNLNKRFMRQYQERDIRNMKRLMKNLFGARRGTKLFAQADKLDVLIVKKTSRLIWRYLQALNKLDGSVTYNNKTFHMVFDASSKTEKQMASVIYGAVYNRLKKHLVKIETTLKEKTLLENGKAYGELKKHVDFMTEACVYLQKQHCRLAGVKQLYVKGDMNVIVHNLGTEKQGVNNGEREL